MSDKRTKNVIHGVGCDVTGCKYNTVDCRCSAEQISVQNEKASDCSTFCPRGCC